MIGCRNNCSFCPQKAIISQYKKNGGIPLLPMNFSFYKSCIDKLPLETCVVFSGMCEAFLNPRCTDMIFYAYEKGLPVSVYTTLMGMTIKDVKRLRKIKFPQNDPHAFVVHLPSVGNIEHIKIDKTYFLVLSEIYESTIPVVFHYHGDALISQLKNFFTNKIATVERFPAHSRASNRIVGQLKRRKGVIGCLKMKLYGSYGPILLPDGTMILCCQDYSMKHILGNFKIQTFNEIVHGDEIQKVELGLKDEHIDILCRNCEFSYDINWLARIANQKVFIPDHHE